MVFSSIIQNDEPKPKFFETKEELNSLLEHCTSLTKIKYYIVIRIFFNKKYLYIHKWSLA
jgi:hypothetical protein